MISLRARIFIIVSLVVLFVLGVSVFLVVKSRNKNNPTANNTAGSGNTAGTGSTLNGAPLPVANLENVKVPKVSTLETEQRAVQNLAKIFVERLNSYSSESRYQNMKDVESMATDSYWKQLSVKIPANIPNSSPNFYAVSVSAYGAKLASWSDKSASVDLQLKITEEKGGQITKKDAQAKVTLVKTGTSWLVDNFTMVK